MDISKYHKLVAAVIPLLAAIALHYGVDLGDGWVGQAEGALDEILILLTPLFVFFAPKNAE